MLYLIDGYHAPSWVIGITWIMIRFMLIALTGGVLDAIFVKVVRDGTPGESSPYRRRAKGYTQ